MTAPLALAGETAPTPARSDVSTRIQARTARAATVQREIGKVPAPYVPLQATKPATPTTPTTPTAPTTAGPESAGPTNPTSEASGPVPVPAPTIVAMPRSLAELASSAEASHRTWIGNHDVLLEILLGPFEANWFKAKACLTMDQWPAGCELHPSHDVGIALMQALVVMRKAKWTQFITTVVKPQFEERMRMFGQVTTPMVDAPKPSESTKAPGQSTLDPAALAGDVDLQSDLNAHDAKQADKSKGKNLQDIFDSVGAEAVTSDVDLASGGSNSELGVQFVNSRFRTHFVAGRVIPYDPGTVFDINVYASDWIHGEAGFSDSSDGTRTITPAAEIAKMSDSDQLERTKKMEVWSLVKVRRNMSPEEWTSYTTKTLASLTEEAAHADMEAKLLAADAEHTKFRSKVEARQAKMLESLTAQEKAFFGERESPFAHEGVDHDAQDASFTRAANAIYEETLQTVKELRVRIEKLMVAPVENEAAISNLGVLLADKIAEALTYANEVYATEGAVQHTVLKQGAGKKLEKLKTEKGQTQLTAVDYDLKPELYLQAVNENVGDSLHSIEHFKHVPKYAVYRAGKYLSRLCDATNLLLGGKKGQVPSYAELLEIGTESVRVKKITKGDIEGDPKFVDDDAFFSKYTAGDLAAVRARIIEFGAMVPKLVGDKKRDEQAAKAAAEQQKKTASTAPVVATVS